MEAPTVTVPRPNGLVTVVLSDAAAVEPDPEAGSGSEEVGKVFKSHLPAQRSFNSVCLRLKPARRILPRGHRGKSGQKTSGTDCPGGKSGHGVCLSACAPWRFGFVLQSDIAYLLAGGSEQKGR